MNKRVVLIVGGRGDVRDGIEALVEAVPEVGKVTCLDDVPRLADRVGNLSPDLVIFDPSQLNEGYRSRLEQLRDLLPSTRILVLVQEEEQKTTSRESGADAVLVKGFRGDLLIRTVRSLIKVGNRGESRTNDSRKER